jgi:hypothetical protein
MRRFLFLLSLCFCLSGCPEDMVACSTMCLPKAARS